MPRAKAPPIDAETFAAFRYGIMLLEDYAYDSLAHPVSLSRAELAIILLGQAELRVDSKPLRALAEQLLRFMFREPKESARREELYLTACALDLNDRAWKSEWASAWHWAASIDRKAHSSWYTKTNPEPNEEPTQAEDGRGFRDPGDVFGETWKFGTSYDPRRHCAPRGKSEPAAPANPPTGDDAAFRRQFCKVLREMLDLMEKEGRKDE